MPVACDPLTPGLSSTKQVMSSDHVCGQFACGATISGVSWYIVQCVIQHCTKVGLHLHQRLIKCLCPSHDGLQPLSQFQTEILFNQCILGLGFWRTLDVIDDFLDNKANEVFLGPHY